MNQGKMYYIGDDKQGELSERVRRILIRHLEKFGNPPEVLLSNKNLVKEVVLPSTMKIVVKSVRLPINHIWCEL